jgi:putative tryptophan/tyrosine transport system substrate-binding protein
MVMNMPGVGFLYCGSPGSLTTQYNAFINALPPGTPVYPPTAAASGVPYDMAQLRAAARIMIDPPHQVQVLVAAGGTISALAAVSETAADAVPTPVVFTAVTDPFSNHLTGGNATGVIGMTTALDAVRLRLLQELVPGIARVGVLRNVGRPNAPQQWGDLMSGRDSRLTLKPGNVNPNAGTIQQAIQGLLAGPHPAEALLVTADPYFNDHRRDVIAPGGVALTIPAIYQWREFADAGGLMSFGPNLVEEYTAAGRYAGFILNGQQPQDIPLFQPTKFELVINNATAVALGLNIPPLLRARAIII